MKYCIHANLPLKQSQLKTCIKTNQTLDKIIEHKTTSRIPQEKLKKTSLQNNLNKFY